MIIKQSPGYLQKLKKLIKKDSRLEESIETKLKLFMLNFKHPSLRLHKIKSKSIDMWSISMDSDLRILFVYREYGILLVDIGGHDEVY
jgi:mRNA-degrading endonuclease YafQ of YafQ-DinJ toxin-antitoxin module